MADEKVKTKKVKKYPSDSNNTPIKKIYYAKDIKSLTDAYEAKISEKINLLRDQYSERERRYLERIGKLEGQIAKAESEIERLSKESEKVSVLEGEVQRLKSYRHAYEVRNTTAEGNSVISVRPVVPSERRYTTRREYIPNVSVKDGKTLIGNRVGDKEEYSVKATTSNGEHEVTVKKFEKQGRVYLPNDRTIIVKEVAQPKHMKQIPIAASPNHSGVQASGEIAEHDISDEPKPVVPEPKEEVRRIPLKRKSKRKISKY